MDTSEQYLRLPASDFMRERSKSCGFTRGEQIVAAYKARPALDAIEGLFAAGVLDAEQATRARDTVVLLRLTDRFEGTPSDHDCDTCELATELADERAAHDKTRNDAWTALSALCALLRGASR